MKTKPAKSLSPAQQAQFAEAFYAHWPIGLSVTDCDTPCPWGAPWTHGSRVILKGNTIEDMANNYWQENKKEIMELIREE
jgi:hypothetical protein